MNDALLSSKSQDWATPPDFFAALHARFAFTLDAAASAENAKCTHYFTPEQDGLSQNWGGQRVWCNPPYGREIGKWVRKGYEEAQKPGTLVVMLLPSRTDTAWYHDYCTRGVIRHLRGRLKFGDGSCPAPFPSMLVLFGFYDL